MLKKRISNAKIFNSHYVNKVNSLYIDKSHEKSRLVI